MSNCMIALVTGANKGIGRQIAGQLAALGHTVVVGARDVEAGERAAAELKAAGGDAYAVVLDVTDPVSAAAAADTVKARFGQLDALVNNAGIASSPGGSLEAQYPGSVQLDEVRSIFETNFFGVISVTEAFLPLLRLSEAPRIVNVSSVAGSLAAAVESLDTSADRPDTSPVSAAYSPSKTALTSLTLQYARGLAPEGILVNAVCPGFVATDLNGFRGTRTPVQGAAAAVRMATVPAGGPTGTFTDEFGPVPW